MLSHNPEQIAEKGVSCAIGMVWCLSNGIKYVFLRLLSSWGFAVGVFSLQVRK
jgi:hypothetical protein